MTVQPPRILARSFLPGVGAGAIPEGRIPRRAPGFARRRRAFFVHAAAAQRRARGAPRQVCAPDGVRGGQWNFHFQAERRRATDQEGGSQIADRSRCEVQETRDKSGPAPPLGVLAPGRPGGFSSSVKPLALLVLLVGCVAPESPEPPPQTPPADTPAVLVPSGAPVAALAAWGEECWVVREDAALERHGPDGVRAIDRLQAPASALFVDADGLYLGGEGWLAGYDHAGRERWRRDDLCLGHVVALARWRDRLYVADAGARVLAVLAADGRALGRLGPHLGRGQLRDLDAGDAGLAVALHRGRLLRLGPDGAMLGEAWPEDGAPLRWARLHGDGVVCFGARVQLLDAEGQVRAASAEVPWPAPLTLAGEDVLYATARGVFNLDGAQVAATYGPARALAWADGRLWWAVDGVVQGRGL